MKRIEKLRSFLSAHPPLVVFIFCIGMTAVAFVSFAYYIKFNNIKRIDVERDWNTVLYNASKVDFCATSNKSDETIFHLNDTYLSNQNYINVSLRLNVALHIPKGYIRAQPVLQLVSNFNSSILGYQGHLSTRITYLTFSLFDSTTLQCKHLNGCVIIKPACVTITAPQEIFSPLKPLPTSCSVQENDTFQSVAFTAALPDDNSIKHCSSVFMKINHQEDERLIVYLTVETRSLVHEHLMRSSYFLFIVIVVILLFGFFRSSHQHYERKTANGYLLT